MLLCANGTYYCGLASDLNRRLNHHASGKGSGYTKKRRPKALVWFERHNDRAVAAARERQLKAWGHKKKKELASGNSDVFSFGNPVWVSLGRARDKLIPPSGANSRPLATHVPSMTRESD